MIVGVPKECAVGETRAATVPAAMGILQKAGHQIVVEPGAGQGAGFPDAAYAAKQARIAGSRRDLFERAQILLMVRGPLASLPEGKTLLPLLRPGQVLIGFQEPFASKEILLELASTGATVFALELLPRTSRAQAMDALSSMAMLAGYKAALLAAQTLPKIFPMSVTAGGTLTPAKVLIIGAGVAGLSAIATSRRLGAAVSAYDLRAAVREEIQSLGARFVDLGIGDPPAAGQGGYAAAQSEEFYKHQREALAKVISGQDIVISTAAVPGKRAPLLVTQEAVKGMAPGSVVVDLAAERGGNCALTQPGTTVQAGGVSILGPVNLSATIPTHASFLYARNVATLAAHLSKDGKIDLAALDEIGRGTLLTHDGKVVHELVSKVLGITPGRTE